MLQAVSSMANVKAAALKSMFERSCSIQTSRKGNLEAHAGPTMAATTEGSTVGAITREQDPAPLTHHDRLIGGR
jgi:hypothetical protein